MLGTIVIDAEYRAQFLHAYMVAAEWSSYHTRDDETSVPIDGLNLDWHPAAESRAKLLCDKFIDAARDMLVEADTRRNGAQPGQNGHDLWLTSNHHGAGFWDRDALDDGELGRRLSDLSQGKPWGDTNLYVGDDNLLHLDGE